jgi:CO/xanthine dehydrogenase FAD-binding subunit
MLATQIHVRKCCTPKLRYMLPYAYKRASTIAEAIEALGAPQAVRLAGGTDLIAQMKTGQRAPRVIVDLKHISDLKTITVSDNGDIEIGAAVSMTELLKRRELAERHQALHDSARMIGSLQIQNRATIGGNICNAAPSADIVPALIADGAIARVAGPDGERTVEIASLFLGPGKTNLHERELLVSIRLPKPAPHSASAYLRYTPRREMDIAIVGAAVRIDLADERTIRQGHVSLASVAPIPLRAASAEAKLQNSSLSDVSFREAARAARLEVQPRSDTRGSAQYRRELTEVLVRRAFQECVGRLDVRMA